MATKKLGISLQAINAQIAALQAKADEIRQREVGEVVAKIKQAIEHYGLTAADLGLAVSAPKDTTVSKPAKPGRKSSRKAKRAASAPKTARPAKYADDQGNTWSGIGKRPEWFKAALAAGKQAAELLVKA